MQHTRWQFTIIEQPQPREHNSIKHQTTTRTRIEKLLALDQQIKKNAASINRHAVKEDETPGIMLLWLR